MQNIAGIRRFWQGLVRFITPCWVNQMPQPHSHVSQLHLSQDFSSSHCVLVKNKEMDRLDLLRSNDSQAQPGAERLSHLADHESRMEFPDILQYHSSSTIERSVATSLCMFSGPRDFLHPCLLPAEEWAAVSLCWGNPAKNCRGHWSATQQPPPPKRMANHQLGTSCRSWECDPSSTLGFTDFSKATPNWNITSF